MCGPALTLLHPLMLYPQWYHGLNPGEVARTGIDGKPRLPVPMMLAFGAAAGLVGQTLTYPFDVVRRQMQVEGLKLHEAAANSPARQLSVTGAFASGGGGAAGAAGAAQQHQQLSLRSTPHALVLLVRQHGWRCLFAGLHINYLKVWRGGVHLGGWGGVGFLCWAPHLMLGSLPSWPGWLLSTWLDWHLPPGDSQPCGCSTRDACRCICHMPACCRPLRPLQVVPSTAIGFTIYDYAKSALALPTNL